MNRLFPISLFLLVVLHSRAQNIPIVSHDTWLVKLGTTSSFPLTGAYHDFSLIKGSDYFWEYMDKPLVSAFAPFVEVNKVVNASFNASNIGFYSYGGTYRQTLTRMEYEGWEGGGGSGVFYEGEGVRSWTDHYLEGHFKITHQFGLGRNYQPMLNTLCFSAGLLMYEYEKRTFTGAFNNGPEYYHEYIFKGMPQRWYIPQLKLNYEFSLVFNSRHYIIMPVVETTLLNFNNILHFGFPEHEPLLRRPEYYKEISFGVMVMRRMTK
jgi:hypothetical protein